MIISVHVNDAIVNVFLRPLTYSLKLENETSELGGDLRGCAFFDVSPR